MDTIRFSPRAKAATIWIVLVLAVYILYRVQEVVMPFIWAILVAYILHPLVKGLAQRTRVPKVIWILLVYVVVLTLLALVISVLIPVIGGQYSELMRAIPGILEAIQNYVRENSGREIIPGFRLNLETVTEQVTAALASLARSLPEQALAGVGLVVGTLFRIVVFLVATFHCLLFGERWGQAILNAFPPQFQIELTPLLHRVHITMTAYLRTQLLRIAMVSTILYIGLTVLDVRFALVLALFGGVMDIVPLIGPFISGGVTALVALFQPTTPFGWSHLTLAIAVVILYVGMNQFEENILLPPLIGYMVDLPPLLVLFSVLAGGSVGGVLGLFLAVPIAATLKIILRYLYAKLMDKPVVFEELPARRPRRFWRRKKEKPQ